MTEQVTAASSPHGKRVAHLLFRHLLLFLFFTASCASMSLISLVLSLRVGVEPVADSFFACVCVCVCAFFSLCFHETNAFCRQGKSYHFVFFYTVMGLSHSVPACVLHVHLSRLSTDSPISRHLRRGSAEYKQTHLFFFQLPSLIVDLTRGRNNC